jgi:hypothetical protein
MFGPCSVCSHFFHYTSSLVIPSHLPVIISKVAKLFAFMFRFPKLKLKTKHYSQVSTGSILCSTYFYHRILTPHASALLIPIKKMRRAFCLFPVRYFQLINRKCFCFNNLFNPSVYIHATLPTPPRYQCKFFNILAV